MRHRETDEIDHVFQIEGHTRDFVGIVKVRRIGPADNQSFRWRGFDYLACDIDAGIADAPMFPCRARFPLRNIVVPPILPRHFRVGDRVPDLLACAADIGHVNLLGFVHLLSPSNACLSADSAASLLRSYLPIQRSAISLMGTGLR